MFTLDVNFRKKRIEGFLKTEYGFVKENDSDTLIEEIDRELGEL
jgi:hypothetical protein